MLGNLGNMLKNLTSRQKSQYGKDALKRKATGEVAGEVSRKRGEAESSMRRKI